MLRKITLVLMSVALTITFVACLNGSQLGITPESKFILPTENVTSIANKLGFGDSYKKYIVEGNEEVCIYTLNEEIVFLLVTANSNENEFPCYGDAFTKEIGGTPIAIATDMSYIVIENEIGKHLVSISARGINEITEKTVVSDYIEEGNVVPLFELISF